MGRKTWHPLPWFASNSRFLVSPKSRDSLDHNQRLVRPQQSQRDQQVCFFAGKSLCDGFWGVRGYQRGTSTRITHQIHGIARDFKPLMPTNFTTWAQCLYGFRGIKRNQKELFGTRGTPKSTPEILSALIRHGFYLYWVILEFLAWSSDALSWSLSAPDSLDWSILPKQHQIDPLRGHRELYPGRLRSFKEG